MPKDTDQNVPPHEDGEDKKYSFLQETIKEKPISREQLMKQFVRVALYGLILGMFACLGFFALKPTIEEWSQGKSEKVTIPNDEELSNPEATGEDQAVEQQTEPETGGYEQLLADMSACAKEAERSIVAVEALEEQDEWSERMTGIRKSTTGVIVADNGRDFLILANNSIMNDTTEWTVTFCNGENAQAVYEKQDRNRGLVVFSVPHEALNEETMETIKVAVLGNSNLINKGDTVLALGNMFGYSQGMAYGFVSSSDYKSTFYDGECDVIATDIVSEKDGTGILFNLNSEVIGIISPSVWENTGEAVVNAYGISDMKPVIELMVNAKSVPYIGIHGTTVTSELTEEHGMPQGIYVVEVDPDSPAMMAGIQAGDIIYEIAGDEVATIAGYENVLLKTAVGTPVKLAGKRQGPDEYVDVAFSVIIGKRE